MQASDDYELGVLEEMLRAGRREQAIRYLQEKTGCSRAKAKDLVDVMEAAFRSFVPPP